MRTSHFFLSPSGRLSPRNFVIAAIVVYLAGAASHLLTGPDIISRAGLWPFVAAQAVLIWVWFVLHAKRLHDAGRPIGLAVGATVLYALSVALLIILAVSFYIPLAGQVPDPNAASALGLILLLAIVALLLGSPHYDFASLVVAILLLLAFVPLLVAVIVTLWAATRPSVNGDRA
jgi:uncharacterized membrane protein YhaH (DUF805 family)